MKKIKQHVRLFLAFAVLLAGFLLVILSQGEGNLLGYSTDMKQAAQLSQQWMDIIAAEKKQRDIYPDVVTNVPNQALIGNDFTMMTTTLGSLESKEISTNPDFAALMVRWVMEAGTWQRPAGTAQTIVRTEQKYPGEEQVHTNEKPSNTGEEPSNTEEGSSNTKKRKAYTGKVQAAKGKVQSDAGTKNRPTAGVIVSGSFPALIVSTLAALQTLDAEVILLTSLGASTYGANQPGATWLDLERWLHESGGLRYTSQMVTRGGENDNGGGLTEEGISLIDAAAARNQRKIYLPANLQSAIRKKQSVLQSADIDILINIGGNQAALGRCSHSASLPNGLNKALPLCTHAERGLLQEVSALGIPVINLLQIKELALEYGMDLSPGKSYAPSKKLYHRQPTSLFSKIVIIISLAGAMILLIPLKNRTTEEEPTGTKKRIP